MNGRQPRTPRILATDDRPEVLRLVERTLGERYECEFATSVAEAREKLAEARLRAGALRHPDAGRVGPGPGRGDRRSTRRPRSSWSPASTTPRSPSRPSALGAHGYLVKPFWPGQLLITAMNALRQRELELAEQQRHAALLGSAEEQAEALRHELIEAQRQAIEELRASRQETVERLARAIEMHDAETGRHVNRMASIAAFLGEPARARPRTRCCCCAPRRRCTTSARSPPRTRSCTSRGRSPPRSASEMERHTTVGHQILADSESDLLRMAATIALTHHERFDGSGYPQGLSGEEIPLEGRIVAVADVFDALLSDRCYRPAMSVEEAVEADRRGQRHPLRPARSSTSSSSTSSEALALRRASSSAGCEAAPAPARPAARPAARPRSRRSPRSAPPGSTQASGSRSPPTAPATPRTARTAPSLPRPAP